MCFCKFLRPLADSRRNSAACVVFVMCIWSNAYIVYSSVITYCGVNDTSLHVLNTTSACVQCSTCPAGYEEVSPCTKTSDTECRPCLNGTFNDESGGSCQNCSRCDFGFYFIQSCNSTADVTCGECGDNFYTDAFDSRVCRPCTGCNQNEKILERCTRRSDTRCGACVRDHFREEATGRCVACSKCYPNVSVIVPECQQKLGHSQILCLPLGYVPPQPTVSETTHKIETSTVPHTDDHAAAERVIVFTLCAFLFAFSAVSLVFTIMKYRFTKSNLWTMKSTDSTKFSPVRAYTDETLNWHCCIRCCFKKDKQLRHYTSLVVQAGKKNFGRDTNEHSDTCFVDTVVTENKKARRADRKHTTDKSKDFLVIEDVKSMVTVDSGIGSECMSEVFDGGSEAVTRTALQRDRGTSAFRLYKVDDKVLIHHKVDIENRS